MKKKIVSTALAASLVVGSLAGIPVNALSTAEALSKIQAAQESKSPIIWLENKSKQIHGALNDKERSVVKATYNNVTSATYATYGEVVDPIWNVIPSDLKKDAVTKENVFGIYKQLKLFALGDPQALGALSTTYDKVLQQAAKDAGLQSGLTKADYEDLAAKVKGNFLKEFQSKEIAALLSNPADIGKNFNAKLQKVVVSAIAESDKFSAIAKTYKLDWNTVGAADKQLASKVTTYNEAVESLAVAAVRAHANLIGKDTNEGTNVVLSVYGAVYGNVTESVYTDVYGGVTTVTYSDYNRYIELKLDENKSTGVKLEGGTLKTTGNKDGVAYVTAYIRKAGTAFRGDEVLFSNVQIPVRYIAPGSNNGGGGYLPGGGGGSISDGVLIDYNNYFKELEKQLAALKSRLASAVSTEEKNRVLDELNALLNKSFAEVTKLNVKRFVVVKDGVAILKLTDNDLRSYVNEVETQFKKWADLFKNVKSDITIPAFALTLDAGSHDVKKYHVSLSKALQELFKSKQAADVSVLTNGLRATLNVASLQEDVEWKTTSRQENRFNNSPIVASDVYKYEFSLKDSKQLPSGAVKATLPLSSSFKLPSRALVVAAAGSTAVKPVNGNYEYAIKNGNEELAITGRSVSYNDISKVRAWAGPKIDFISALGIMEGVGSNRFAPKAPTTRGEVAKMFVLGFDLKEKEGSKTFTDVSSSKWYAKYIRAAADQGILSGYPGGTFKPEAKISRAEFAATAVRLLQQKHGWKDVTDPDQVLKKFKDYKSIHPSLKADVALAVEKGILVGDKGKLKPNDSTNRAESAVILYRLLNK
ncbi:S-layer homology domain-containing protein [Paenibacillus sp. SC116]|uniref:S-layer homology domain-containing protein n=1 Tax=Paenibacillus sp. SC116 TaxID=2968986 RepID=UPI00215AFB67|nr:S-layer homology domain-containing protein [Paenibacillus sp. SC116]MCR8843771.1 S-layer homology domain-containing protein [Paenibacillus sp. SC116]